MKLKAINVNQGDSFIFSDFPEECWCKSKKNISGIIFDTWGWHVDISSFLERDASYILCLSHLHMDHIGGLNHVMQNKSKNKNIKIDEVWLPYYSNELVNMLRLIRNLWLQIWISSNNSWFQKVRYALSILESLIDENCIWIYEWVKLDFCNHIDFLNPTIFQDERNREAEIFKISPLLWLKRKDLSLFLNKDFSIYTYLLKESNGQINLDILTHLYFREDIIKHKEGDWRDWRIHFFNLLVYSISNSLISLVKKPSESSYTKLVKLAFSKINNQSIVFWYRENTERYSLLMTWDAEKPVFKRLIDNKIPLSSRILKVPHHWSRGAMNWKILDKINPEMSIISHDNRKFSSWSPHPHIEVLKALDNKEIIHLHTNAINEERSYNSAFYYPPSRKPPNSRVANSTNSIEISF